MRQRIFSGIKPSGDLHIGNYLGAIRQWVDLQHAYDATLCVVDLHAITVPQDPADLRRRTLDIAKTYLAAGIDPEQTTIFVQSHVPAHAELAWVLNSVVAKVGDLTKMTQLKDKAGLVDEDILFQNFDEFAKMESSREIMEALKNMPSSEVEKTAKFSAAQTLLKFLKEKYINPLNVAGVGLFDYPVLMAADILLYDTDVVPVGDDQVQHVELTRTLARRFNKRFGDTFKIPQSLVNKEAARIMALDDPTRKMSKSATSEYGYIALADDPDVARRKIMKAVTDSGTDIVYADDKPALKNLVNIYSLLADKTPEAIEAEYVGKGYADFKRDLGDVVAVFLADFQSKLAGISDDETLRVLRAGAEKARETARKKLSEVYDRAGFL